jgi:hypothetical protein
MSSLIIASRGIFITCANRSNSNVATTASSVPGCERRKRLAPPLWSRLRLRIPRLRTAHKTKRKMLCCYVIIVCTHTCIDVIMSLHALIHTYIFNVNIHTHVLTTNLTKASPCLSFHHGSDSLSQNAILSAFSSN